MDITKQNLETGAYDLEICYLLKKWDTSNVEIHSVAEWVNHSYENRTAYDLDTTKKMWKTRFETMKSIIVQAPDDFFKQMRQGVFTHVRRNKTSSEIQTGVEV